MKYITEKTLINWQSEGKNVLKVLKTDVNKSREETSEQDISKVMQDEAYFSFWMDFFDTVTVSVEELKVDGFLKDLMEDDSVDLFKSSLVQSLWIVAFKFAREEENKERIFSVVKLINEANLIDYQTAESFLPASFLFEFGLVENEDADSSLREHSLQTRRNIISLHYTNIMYNLIEENLEGYSRVVYIFLTLKTVVDPAQLVEIKDQVLKLVGLYKLDSNTVFSLLLDALTIDFPLSRSAILSSFTSEQPVLFDSDRILFPFGQKLLIDLDFGSTSMETNLEDLQQFKEKTYALCERKFYEEHLHTLAELTSKNIVQVESVLPFLNPTDEMLVKDLLRRQEYLSGGESNSIDFQESKFEQTTRLQRQKARVTKHNILNDIFEKTNLKVVYIQQLLSLGAWNEAQTAIDLVDRAINATDENKVSYLEVKQLSFALGQLVNLRIKRYFTPFEGDKYYEYLIRRIGKQNLETSDQFFKSKSLKILLNKFFEEIYPVLIRLLFRIGYNLKAFLQVVSLLACVGRKQPGLLYQPDYKEKVLYLIKRCFLPGLSVVDAKFFKGDAQDYDDLFTEVHYFLSKIVGELNYKERYAIYAWVAEQGFRPEQSIVLNSKKNANVQDTRQKLKRLANSDEAMKKLGEDLRHTAKNDSFNCFEVLLKNAMSYDNLIPVFAESLRKISRLSHDVLGFSLSRQLQNSLKAHNVSNVRALSNFVCSLAKEYRNFDLSPFLDLIISNLLYCGEDLDGDEFSDVIFLLKQILEELGGNIFISDVTESMAQTLSGRPILKESNNETINYLRKEIEDYNRRQVDDKKTSLARKLSVPLMRGAKPTPIILQLFEALEFQQKLLLERLDRYMGYFKDIEGVSQKVDMCNQCILQLGDILNQEIYYGWIEQYLPKEYLYKTLESNNLGLNSFFLIYRAVARKIRWNRLELLKRTKEDTVMIEPPNPTFATNNGLENSNSSTKKTQTEQPASQQPGLSEQIIQLEGHWAYNNTEMLPHFFSPKVSWAKAHVSTHLISLFWSLSAIDIYCPQENYDAHKNVLTKELKRLSEHVELIQKYVSKDRKVEDLEAEKQHLVKKIETLEKESSLHAVHKNFVLIDLIKQPPKFHSLFVSTQGESDTSTAFVMKDFFKLCLLQRTKLSSLDAFYCYRFLTTLENLKVPRLSLELVAENIPLLFYIIFHGTEQECKNVSFFLNLFLQHYSSIVDSKGRKKLDVISGRCTSILVAGLTSKTNHVVRCSILLGLSIVDLFPTQVTDTSKLKLLVVSVAKEITKHGGSKEQLLLPQRYLLKLSKKISTQSQGAKKNDVKGASPKVSTSLIEKETQTKAGSPAKLTQENTVSRKNGNSESEYVSKSENSGLSKKSHSKKRGRSVSHEPGEIRGDQEEETASNHSRAAPPLKLEQDGKTHVHISEPNSKYKTVRSSMGSDDSTRKHVKDSVHTSKKRKLDSNKNSKKTSRAPKGKEGRSQTDAASTVEGNSHYSNSMMHLPPPSEPLPIQRRNARNYGTGQRRETQSQRANTGDNRNRGNNRRQNSTQNQRQQYTRYTHGRGGRNNKNRS
eukprot:snap_masked-scaffold_10-processed-gene-13.10-mRNA-1 protein AED:1.00 eAED:1.00 QI:0/0/0/0/1/1/2/0/1553